MADDPKLVEAQAAFDEWYNDNNPQEAGWELHMDLARKIFIDGYLLNTTSKREAAEEIVAAIANTPTYQDLCEKTEAPITPELLARAVSVVRDLHGLMGIVTEIGELLDAYKKYIFYGKAIDATNVAEEIGDISWYLSLMFNVRGLRQQNVQAANIAKLKARYGDKFTEDAANQRDLVAERRTLDDAMDAILKKE